MLPSQSQQDKIFLYFESDGQTWVVQVLQGGKLDKRIEADSRVEALQSLVGFLLGESQISFHEPDESDQFCLLRGDRFPTGPDDFYAGEDQMGNARVAPQHQAKPVSTEEAFEIREKNPEYEFKIFSYPYKES
jgi:hypothetical protein